MNDSIMLKTGQMSQRRLHQWKSLELSLQQQLNSTKSSKKKEQDEEQDILRKQITELMVSIGYTFNDVGKIIEALKHGKKEPKSFNKDEDDLALIKEVDVFENLRSQLRPVSGTPFKLPVENTKKFAPFDIKQWQRATSSSYSKYAIGKVEKETRKNSTDNVDQPSEKQVHFEKTTSKKTSKKTSPRMQSKYRNHPEIIEEEWEEIELFKPSSSMRIVERIGGNRKIRPQTVNVNRQDLADMRAHMRSRSAADLRKDKTPDTSEDEDEGNMKVRTQEEIHIPKTPSESSEYKFLLQEHELLDSYKRPKFKPEIRPLSKLPHWQRDLMSEAPPGLYSSNKPIKVTLARSKSRRESELKELVQKNMLREQMDSLLSGKPSKDVQARIKLVQSVMKVEEKKMF